MADSQLNYMTDRQWGINFRVGKLQVIVKPWVWNAILWNHFECWAARILYTEHIKILVVGKKQLKTCLVRIGCIQSFFCEQNLISQDTRMVFLLNAQPLECSNCALATSAVTCWPTTQGSLQHWRFPPDKPHISKQKKQWFGMFSLHLF